MTNSVGNLTNNHQRLQQNILVLKSRVKKNYENINHLIIKQALLEQVLLLSVLLNQYAYVYQNLIATFHAAENTLINTSYINFTILKNDR